MHNAFVIHRYSNTYAHNLHTAIRIVMHAHTPLPQGLISTSCSDCVVLGCHRDTHMASCQLLVLSTCSLMFQIWSKVSWNFDNPFCMQLNTPSPLISSWNSIRYTVFYALSVSIAHILRYDSSTREASFSVGLQGIREEDVPQVKEIVWSTLERVAR